MGNRPGSRAFGWRGAVSKQMLVAVLAVTTLLLAAMPAAAASRNYQNPLDMRIPNDGVVESCADPTVIQGQTAGDDTWYMYCTTDPLNSEDKTGNDFKFHLVPMLTSTDLVNWTYAGD